MGGSHHFAITRKGQSVMDLGLKNRTVIVTGGAAGLGALPRASGQDVHADRLPELRDDAAAQDRGCHRHRRAFPPGGLRHAALSPALNPALAPASRWSEPGAQGYQNGRDREDDRAEPEGQKGDPEAGEQGHERESE